ncbi:cellobiose phosphotransferase system celC [Minicystis rosea]|nr:cellobiose phosphotransferase system celC [Minicystis rosea]
MRLRLVVTADDMGMRPAWDRAIEAAYERGVVTSVSVVTNGGTYREAAARLRASPVDRGVHLNLLEGEPLAGAGVVPSLVDDGGRLLGSVARFVSRWARGGIHASDVERECNRQIERALDDGLAPSHLNAHYHLHVLPGYLAMLSRLARRHAIRWLRVPDEPPSLAGLGPTAKTSILWWLAKREARGVRAMDTPRLVPCRGIAASGRLDVNAWRRVLSRLDHGVTEVLCHPGQSDPEMDALMSPALRRAIDAVAERTSFRALDPRV